MFFHKIQRNGGARGLSHIIILFNPLRPKSDLNEIYHLSVREVMIIENMNYQVKRDSPHYFCKKCMETKPKPNEKRTICNLIVGLKELITGIQLLITFFQEFTMT